MNRVTEGSSKSGPADFAFIFSSLTYDPQRVSDLNALMPQMFLTAPMPAPKRGCHGGKMYGFS